MQYLDVVSKWQNGLGLFPRKILQHHSNPSLCYAPTTNVEEAEADWFYEDLQDLLEQLQKKMSANLKNSAVAQDWKKSVFIPVPKKDNAKECTNYHTIMLISHATKIMLKILQTGLQHNMNWEIPDVHAGFQRGRGTRD